ncbi:MAG: hypothetical protein GTN40_03820 [Candidatus Aenigmarchaeota archaeon]|nr:hypothetical protein [Candidatus Aenigmarchaeota archaeon]
MSHIDFAIGFVLIISTIFLIIYFTSNSISNNVNDLSVNEIKESSLSLEKYLFEISDDKSLISTFRELQTILTEVNDTDHSEEIRISIKPDVSKVKVYDNLMNEIPSTSSQLVGETVLSFLQDFTANEEKSIGIYYFGDAVVDIDYLSTENNISLRILSNKELNVVSQEKCSNFKSKSYEYIKEDFGFQNQFRLDLDGCSYGPEPSLTANIILKNIPVLSENSDGLLRAKIARLRIW